MSERAHSQLKSAPGPSLMPAPSGLLQRKCECGGSPVLGGECAECRKNRLLGGDLQTKLRISQPGDRFEREADRVADQVMRMPEPDLQRQAEKEVEEGLPQTKPLIQRRVTDGEGGREALPIVHEALRSPGHPLDPTTRAFMESRFGHDFSQVRVHTDARAAESAKAMSAQAFTVGDNVVFGAGRYAPQTQEGRSLLAHELVHTMQQRDVYTWQDASPDRSAPTEPAKQISKYFVGSVSSISPHIQRQPLEEDISGDQPSDHVEDMATTSGGRFGGQQGFFECAINWVKCRKSCLNPKAESDCADCCDNAFDRCRDTGVWITKVRGCDGLGPP